MEFCELNQSGSEHESFRVCRFFIQHKVMDATWTMVIGAHLHAKKLPCFLNWEGGIELIVLQEKSNPTRFKRSHLCCPREHAFVFKIKHVMPEEQILPTRLNSDWGLSNDNLFD